MERRETAVLVDQIIAIRKAVSLFNEKKNISDLHKCRLDGDCGGTATQRSYIKLILEK